jgi:hypothetical protein
MNLIKESAKFEFTVEHHLRPGTTCGPIHYECGWLLTAVGKEKLHL